MKRLYKINLETKEYCGSATVADGFKLKWVDTTEVRPPLSVEVLEDNAVFDYDTQSWVIVPKEDSESSVPTETA